MYGVVNRLTFTDPVDGGLAARLRDDAMPRIAAVGCRDAYVVGLLAGPTDRRTGEVVGSLAD